MYDDGGPTRVRDARRATTELYAHHDPTGTGRFSTTLIHALADAMGADVTAAGARLRERIDPDSLDLLFVTNDEQSTPPSHLAFDVDGYRTTVYSDGRIVITPPPRPAGGPHSPQTP